MKDDVDRADDPAQPRVDARWSRALQAGQRQASDAKDPDQRLVPSTQRRALVLMAPAAWLAACGGGGDAGAPTTGPTGVRPSPAQTLDLSHVTLTLPIRSDGSFGGVSAQTLTAAQLTAAPRGYESEFLYTDAEARVRMWCPVNGALSSASSDAPRCEFRHQLTPGTNDGFVLGEARSRSMSVEMAVLTVPPIKRSIIIAQVHGLSFPVGSNQNAAPLLLVYFSPSASGSTFDVVAKLRNSPDSSASATYEAMTIMRSVSIADLFILTIKVDGQQIYVNQLTRSLPTPWLGVSAYFKTGVYLDEIGTSPIFGGDVGITRLTFAQ